MDEYPRHHLINLRTERSQRGLNSAIAELLSETGLAIDGSTVVRLAGDLQHDPKGTMTRFLEIEGAIGGVGLHNVNRRDGEWLTGVYRDEFRPLFRPIQYATRNLFDQDLEWDARFIVQWSCGHVEDALKFRFSIPKDDRASLGVLLTSRPPIQSTLDQGFLKWMLKVNVVIYRGAKHAMEDLDVDVHLFTPPDAVATYFMCRWAGVKLLEPTGIFSVWQRPFEPV